MPFIFCPVVEIPQQNKAFLDTVKFHKIPLRISLKEVKLTLLSMKKNCCVCSKKNLSLNKIYIHTHTHTCFGPYMSSEAALVMAFTH